jgi:plasmid stabilization system protein ParE
MEYRFEFAPRALAQAREVHDWIAESSPERAAKWYQGLFETIETL